jgi:hypothetical protein
VTRLAVVLAYVLILAKSGRENEILDALKEFKQVTEARTTLGSWDIIAAVESESMDSLYVLVERIRRLRYVERTSTLITR